LLDLETEGKEKSKT